MGQKHRLGLLQMGVTWQDRTKLLFGQGEELRLQRPDKRQRPACLLPQVEADVQRDLIVPAPARVELAACVADPADQGLFDGHVDVLVVWRKDKFPRPDLGENRPEAGADLPCLGRRDDPLPGKHAGMGDAPFNVVAVEAPVVMER